MDEITVTTQFLTLKILDYKPNFAWWYENLTSAIEEYCIRFTKIQEYFGINQYLSDRVDLGGISYNLLTSEWETIIVEHEEFVSVNLTLSGLANNVIIQFIIQVFSVNNVLNYSNELVAPLVESQIEIIVKNWVYTPGAQGLAIKSEVYERANNDYVFIANQTTRYHNIDSLSFNSYTGYESEKAYYNWVEYAGYSNETTSQFPVEIGSSFFNEVPSIPGENEMIHLWFSYPEELDLPVITHNVILGVYRVSPTFPSQMVGTSYYYILSSILGVNILLIIFQRRKNKNRL
ncbi:MAG TPA: hypothetical protein VMZ29_15020 [Candidatus Bathyarchaeia archaeon]|nr:hypothetical protein [Candidatus Bathyarchaeia archaeon]